MKIKIILVMIIMLIFTFPVYAFSDIEPNNEFSDDINYLAECGVLTGYNDGEFKPNNYLSRAEFSTIACRLMNIVSEAKKREGKTDFNDVAASHWASGYINAAVAHEIINGMGDGTFRPDDKLTNWQAVKMLVSMTNQLHTVYSYYVEYPNGYIAAAKELGIYFISEKETVVSRGEIAHMIYTALDVPILNEAMMREIGTLRDNIQQSYQFKDQAVAFLSAHELNKEIGDIKPADLAKITCLDEADLPDEMYVHSLEDIIYMQKLSSVILPNQKIADISPLQRIKDKNGNYKKSFGEIDLYGNRIGDISPLENLEAVMPISFPYDKNDKWGFNLNYDEYREMMDIVYEVIDNYVDKNEPIKEQLRAVHDYIINNCRYNNDNTKIVHTAYGALINGEAVCEGYTEAFKVFCDVIGIENNIISGIVEDGEGGYGSHAWNEVIVNGKSHYVDVTWDDPNPDGQLTYEYFWLDEMPDDHIATS